MHTDLMELVQNLGQPHVLVVGDLMLDRYVWGNATRISQEAPVLLLQADHREERLGGASSVATLLRALGASVSLTGVIGNDTDGQRVHEMLADLGVDYEGVIIDYDRPTTVKERYVGRAQDRHPQQMLRVDYETRKPISDAIETELVGILKQQLERADIVLVSDYDKGVCTSGLLTPLIAAAKMHGCRVLGDPIRGQDYRKYHGFSLLTPNRLEAGLATGRELTTVEEAFAAGRQLRAGLDMEAALITLDKEGMVLCHVNGEQAHFPTRPRQVYDITGAGDMVLAMLGVALAAGVGYEEAVQLANVAGGLEVEKVGVATVTREEIVRDLLKSATSFTTGAHPGAEKTLSRDTLLHELDCRRRLGQKIAFTNGCFDVLHAGHVQYLHEARAQADTLVVGLNSDESVRALKGPDRPVNDVEARRTVLAGLSCVDYVVVFDQLTPLELIRQVRPDVLIKGADYHPDEVVGSDYVESYGGRVHLASLREGFSTTSVLQRLGAA